MPQVSIIIPVRNAARHLRECLDSVLSQSLRDVEVICVDNGSADESLSILEDYAAADSRVKVMRCESGRGAGAARNVGLSAATGNWLHFVDADDVVLEDAEKSIVDFAERDGADIVVFNADEFDDATGMVTPMPLDLSVLPQSGGFLKAYATCPWNKLFRRSFIVDQNIRFQEIPRSNDLAFTVEALCRASRISVLDRVFYKYRIHGGGGLQATKNETPNAWRDALEEAQRRLSAAGKLDRFREAFNILSKDVRLANKSGILARVLASIRRRGVRSFVKHVVGFVAMRFRK